MLAAGGKNRRDTDALATPSHEVPIPAGRGGVGFRWCDAPVITDSTRPNGLLTPSCARLHLAQRYLRVEFAASRAIGSRDNLAFESSQFV